MMGERQVRQEALFYGFSLEEHVPADHLLRSNLRAETAREFKRLHLVLRHMRALDADLQAALTQEAPAFPHRHKAGVLTRLAGVGTITAAVLVAEVLHRRFQSRRHLASYLELAPTPFASGGRRSTRAGRADATRASARRATSRRAACLSSSPKAGCATSPAAAWRPGTGGPSPNGASGGARLGSWPWPASWRSRCGASSRTASCPKGRC